ncbi:MAG TPA: CHAD domain-containing protein [Bdellovibrio sp.]|nr:CHAD domain-containing protein [Bdellovibrio sp.]
MLHSNIDEFNQLTKHSKKISFKKVHELRILTRKFRAALWIAEKNRVKPPRKIKKQLRSMGRRLGQCRQIDVLIGDAETYHFSTRRLQKQKQKVQKKLVHHLEKEKLKSLQKELLRICAKVKLSSSSSYLKRSIAHPLQKWPQNFPSDKAKLHALRIEAKKIIYRLSLLEVKPAPLKKLQKHLGRVHDLEVLAKHFSTKKKIRRDLKYQLLKAHDCYRQAKDYTDRDRLV